MPRTDETKSETPSLESRLEAAESAQDRNVCVHAHRAMAQGYRYIGEVLGGVLMGVGLGWILDLYSVTSPLGIVGGLLIGSGLSIFVAVRTATRNTKDAMAKAGPLPVVADD